MLRRRAERDFLPLHAFAEFLLCPALPVLWYEFLYEVLLPVQA